ncbi:HAD-IA family hydrolase [Vibrio porteresiae]|uniref:HAD-IA family hydrolase n=1 Tax=Vibrio porteresiae DSM 19223 TaxID=1123496 RepID=A0ABZ0QJ56_9VIBR|nr:HAD-IA family hydrolase [Vibrio porteresiae]WPC75530.1 HAD-IA family hydrolase [Vibrio porteresiae DSM 19223]
MTKTKKQCVIFDCEGTLVDSERLCCQVLQQLLREIGVILSLNEVMKHFDGGKSADILNQLLMATHVHADVDALEIEYRRRTDALFKNELQAMPGAKALLQRLKEQRIDMCIASNAPREKIAQMLSNAGLADYFQDHIYSGFDANSWKPDPDLIHYCAMNMGYRLDDCVYIDDTLQGVTAGVLAGVKTFHLQGSARMHECGYPEVESLQNLADLSQFLELPK